MKRDAIGDLLGYAVMIGGILALTRPGSNAPKQISDMASGYASILRVATGADSPEVQLRLFEDSYMREPDRLTELEADLDRKLGLARERSHRSWFDQQLGHVKVRERKVEW